MRVVKTVPNRPRAGSIPVNPGMRRAPYPPVGGVDAAEMVKVEDEVPPGEIVEGLREQVRPEGAVHVREI